MTPDEFASKIKAKYPDYADWDNLNLTRRILAKYPVYRNWVQLPELKETPIKDAVLKAIKTIAPGGRTFAATAESGAIINKAIDKATVKAAEVLGEPAGMAVGVPLQMVRGMIPETETQAALSMLAPPISVGTMQKALGPMAARLTRQMRSIAQIAAEEGIPLTVADITQSTLVSTVESRLEKTMLGAGPIQAFKQRQIDALKAARDRLLRKFGPSQEAQELGLKLKDSLAAETKIAYAKGDALYARVGEMLTPGEAVPRTHLDTAAKSLLQKERVLPPKWRDSDLESKLTGLLEPGTEPSYQMLVGIRSKLGQLIADEDAAIKAGLRTGQKFLGNRQGGAYKTLYKAVSNDLADFAKSKGGDFEDAYNAARSFWRDAKARFDNKTIRKVIKANPERIVDLVFRPNNLTEIDAVRRAVGENGFQPLKQKFLEKVVSVMEKEGQAFHPAALSRELGKYGQETLGRVFTPKEIAEINQLGQIGNLLNTAEKLAGAPSGIARNTIYWGPVGLSVWSPMVGAATILGPAAISRLYLSPLGRRYLAQGFRLPANDARAVGVASGIMALIGTTKAEQYMTQEDVKRTP